MTDEPLSALDALLGGAPQRRQRHWISLAVLVLAGAAAFVLFARFLYGTDSPYYTARVERGDITPTLDLRGELHGDGEVTLVAARDGTVVSVPDPAEARLRAGQDLVAMDTQATARLLDTDNAALQLASTTLERAQGALHEAKVRLDRYEAVWRRSGGRVPSLNEMENARGDVARAEADLANAQTRRQAAQSLVERDRAAMAGAVARAPYAGYLIGCRVAPGQAIRAGQPLCTIAAHPEKLTLVAPVSDADAARLPPGADAGVLVDGLAESELDARLVQIAPARGGGRQAVFALLPPENGPKRLPAPGRGATVSVDLAERSGVLLVPNAALGFSLHGEARGGRPGVYVVHGSGAPRLVPVALGAGDGERTEVLSSNLAPGDQVIIGWRQEKTPGGAGAKP